MGRRSDPIRVVGGADLAGLALTPEEGYLLSRAQGCGRLGELLLSSGLPEAKAAALVRSLREKGALAIGAPEAPAPEAPHAPKSRYDGFIFNPADLAEEVELDVETRKELLFLHAHLGDLTHYDVLEVRPRTPAAEIRKAYFEKSRLFHPDRYYGKNLGSYRARLAQVFQRIVEAYETLSDAGKKAAYDRVTDLPLDEEEIAEVAAAQRQQAEEARRTRERRERLRRRSPFLQRRDKAHELVAEAEKALGQEDWRKAAGLYKLAESYDPNDRSLAGLHDEADRRARALRAEALHDRAAAAEALGNIEDAERLLREAAEADPSGVRWQASLARHLLRRGRGAEALGPAKRAVEAAPRSAEAWTLRGQALVAAGEKKEAKAAFQRAVALDETADEAKEGLKSLRWSLF